MRLDVTNRRWRRLSAVVQLLLFAFSASTSLLPCANDMVASKAQVETEHHASAFSHASHTSHAAQLPDAPSQDAPEPTSPPHHAPDSHTSSGSCPWVVGCTGVVHFTLESSWRLVETTPVVSAPSGVVLRAVYAERDVESPPPRG